jgi:hypothetical protein
MAWAATTAARKAASTVETRANRLFGPPRIER